MTAMKQFRGKTIGILGMARSGLAAAEAAIAAGADVQAFDDSPVGIQRAKAIGCKVGTKADIRDLTIMIVSPGVPLTHAEPHPLIRICREYDIALTCDIDLFVAAAREAGHRVIAVTGTNGKSTTTALIAHLLAHFGRQPLIGGNIGKPVFELKIVDVERPVVLEVSSFQLDLCRELSPDIAVWLNISPDHLDRHGDMAGYVAAKMRIFEGQGPDELAVVGIDDDFGRKLEPKARLRTFGTSPSADIVCRATGIDFSGVEIADLASAPNLRGAHNTQNAAAAFAAVSELVDWRTVDWEGGFASFAGLPHRMEICAKCRSITFVNDSKATNPSAAEKSLASLTNIHWIAGGRAKPGGFRSLRPFLAQVKKIYAIGEAESEIVRDLGDLAPVCRSGTLDVAMERAFSEASGGSPVILLAPACASFDQFANFEERGDRFRQKSFELCATEMAA